MKNRILISIAIGYALVISYGLVVVIIVLASCAHDHLAYPEYDYPLSLPKSVMYYFFPPTPAELSGAMTSKKLMIGLVSIIANGLLYSLPVWMIMERIARARGVTARHRAAPEQPQPPEWEA